MTVTSADIIGIYPDAAKLGASAIDDMITFVEGFLPGIITPCGYSETMTDAITRYMVAHYLAVGYERGGLIRKRTGESEEVYRELSNEATGLNSTVYGQQALALDLGGCLGIMAANVLKAQFRII